MNSFPPAVSPGYSSYLHLHLKLYPNVSSRLSNCVIWCGRLRRTCRWLGFSREKNNSASVFGIGNDDPARQKTLKYDWTLSHYFIEKTNRWRIAQKKNKTVPKTPKVHTWQTEQELNVAFGIRSERKRRKRISSSYLKNSIKMMISYKISYSYRLKILVCSRVVPGCFAPTSLGVPTPGVSFFSWSLRNFKGLTSTRQPWWYM